jgi:hypothetical protein
MKCTNLSNNDILIVDQIFDELLLIFGKDYFKKKPLIHADDYVQSISLKKSIEVLPTIVRSVCDTMNIPFERVSIHQIQQFEKQFYIPVFTKYQSESIQDQYDFNIFLTEFDSQIPLVIQIVMEFSLYLRINNLNAGDDISLILDLLENRLHFTIVSSILFGFSLFILSLSYKDQVELRLQQEYSFNNYIVVYAIAKWVCLNDMKYEDMIVPKLDRTMKKCFDTSMKLIRNK